jgi:Rod binding domain-containing protein
MTDSNEMGMYQDMFDKQVALTISQHAGSWGSDGCSKRQLGGKASQTATPPGLPRRPAGAGDPRRWTAMETRCVDCGATQHANS